MSFVFIVDENREAKNTLATIQELIQKEGL